MTAPRRPPGRYDERRPLSRPVLITLASVLGLALLGLSYLAWSRFTGSGTTAFVRGYRVVNDHTVEVRFEVHKAAKATVHCVVQARDRDGVAVAVETVTIGPSATSSTVVTRSLTTTRRAAIGEVVSCGP